MRISHWTSYIAVKKRRQLVLLRKASSSTDLGVLTKVSETFKSPPRLDTIGNQPNKQLQEEAEDVPARQQSKKALGRLSFVSFASLRTIRTSSKLQKSPSRDNHLGGTVLVDDSGSKQDRTSSLNEVLGDDEEILSTQEKMAEVDTSPMSQREPPTMVNTEEEEPPRGTLERQLTSTFDREVLMDVNNGEASISDPKPVVSLDDIGKPVDEEFSSTMDMFTGVATDIGGSNVNQDKSCCFRTGKHGEHAVLAVFDGHGRELGELAAIVARDYMKQELKKLEVIEKLKSNPTETCNELFLAAHLAIKERFRTEINQSADYDAFEDKNGYLIKKQRARGFKKNQNKKPRAKRSSLFQGFLSRSNNDNPPTTAPEQEDKSKVRYVSEGNVHGGTTATLVVILDEKRMIVANVGDSTAIFGGLDKHGEAWCEELSAEHSPESLSEFRRVSAEIPSKDKRVRFVFDVLDKTYNSTPKYACPPIFTIDEKSGHVRTQNNGYYYKNVRSEWATLVTTPPTARFQDALAFTRSLGDLHLHYYGVSYVPEIKEFDVTEMMLKNGDRPSVLMVCSDGIWDNWKYQDIINKTMKSDQLKNTLKQQSAQALTDEIMSQNKALAKKHFGDQADNMTGVFCIIQAKSTN